MLHNPLAAAPPRGRSAAALALTLFMVTSCFDARACEDLFEDCDGDQSCGDGSVCEVDLLGKACISVIECSSDAECPGNASCVQRESQPADNPFEADHVGKRVCDCLSDCGVVTTSGSTTSVGGQGAGAGGSGAGASGAGAAGAGGGGVGGAGGAGGAAGAGGVGGGQ